MAIARSTDIITDKEWQVYHKVKRICGEEDIAYLIQETSLPAEYDLEDLKDWPQELFNHLVTDFVERDDGWFDDAYELMAYRLYRYFEKEGN